MKSECKCESERFTSAVPATKSALRGSPRAVPATKSACRGSPSAVPATEINVLCLSRNLRVEVHKVLYLSRNLHFEVHKVLRLPRNLHIEGHRAVPATQSANEPHVQKSRFTAPVTKSEPLDDHHHVQPRKLHFEVKQLRSLAPVTTSRL